MTKMDGERDDASGPSSLAKEGQDELLGNVSNIENNTEKDGGTNEGVAEDRKDQKLSLRKIVTHIKTDKSYRQKIVHTAILCWSFVGLGWSAGMNGPTFPDLRQIVQEDLAKSAWMFTVGSFGYLSGSLIGGLLYDKLNKVLLLAGCSLGSGISTLLTPYCSTLQWMLFIKFIGGFFFGGLDTGGNADIINIWGRGVDPYMQALHFAFSVGALLSPLATEPFLAGQTTACIENNMTSATSSGLIITSTDHTVINSVLNGTGDAKVELKNASMLKCVEQSQDTNVHYAFLIATVFMITSTAGFIFLYTMLRRNKQQLTISNIENELASNGKNERQKEMSGFVKMVLLVLLSLLIAAYCVAEDSFAGFFMTFSLDYLGWDKSLGSFATAVFWFSFGVGRFAGIFIVSCCKNSTLLTSYLLMLGFGYLGFLLATHFKYDPLIWVFIAILGFSMSVIFPAIFSWTSEHIVHVTGKISAIFLTSSCVAGMSFPLLIGYLMEHYHPMWYSYILVIMTFVCILLYFVIRVLDKCCLKKQAPNTDADGKEAAEETEMTLIQN